MIDIEFVSGINRARLAKSLKKAGMTHRFAVVQHREIGRELGDGFDGRLFWALLDFMSDYDPAADLLYADDWGDIGVREHPIEDLIAQWKSDPTAQRRLPDVFLLRNRGQLQVCMICEGYGLEDRWPYNDSDTFAMLSNRDISREILAYLHAHENAAKWKLSPDVVDLQDTGRRLPFRNRTRENTEPPKRGRGPLWTWLTLLALVIIPSVAMMASVHTAHEAYQCAPMAIIAVGLVVAFLVHDSRDLDVSLTWDGIRKGKGSRSKFIAWEDARLSEKKNTIFVRSKTRTISIRQEHFDETKFWVFFRLIRQEIEERGLKRADEGEAITTPVFALSADDLKKFNKYRGKGSGRSVLSDLQPLVLPIAIVTILALMLWIGPQRHKLPHILQYPSVFIATALVCVGLLYAIGRLGDHLFFGAEPVPDREDTTLALTNVGLVGQSAMSRHLKFWDEIRWIVQTPTLILFYYRPGAATIVPKRVFASPDEAASFFNQALALKKAYAE